MSVHHPVGYQPDHCMCMRDHSMHACMHARIPMHACVAYIDSSSCLYWFQSIPLPDAINI